MIRLAWILGLVSTRNYGSQLRAKRFGPEASSGSEGTLKHLERMLFEDRLAIILFLVGAIIFAYTFLQAPAFHQ